MSKHTKGPWVVGPEFTDLMACPEGGRFHAIDAPTYGHFALAVVVTQLADDYPPGSTCAELMANATLIAAAPELLDALSLFVLMVEKDQILTIDRHRAALIRALTAANAAITKATGVPQ